MTIDNLMAVDGEKQIPLTSLKDGISNLKEDISDLKYEISNNGFSTVKTVKDFKQVMGKDPTFMMMEQPVLALLALGEKFEAKNDAPYYNAIGQNSENDQLYYLRRARYTSLSINQEPLSATIDKAFENPNTFLEYCPAIKVKVRNPSKYVRPENQTIADNLATETPNKVLLHVVEIEWYYFEKNQQTYDFLKDLTKIIGTKPVKLEGHNNCEEYHNTYAEGSIDEIIPEIGQVAKKVDGKYVLKIDSKHVNIYLKENGDLKVKVDLYADKETIMDCAKKIEEVFRSYCKEQLEPQNK